MLTLRAGSSCDICFENFAEEEYRIPSSIPCGHVFCSDCLGRYPCVCALCRMPFREDQIIRLRIDLEGPAPELEPEGLDKSEAQRLSKAVADIAVNGIAQGPMQQLIEETRAFLSSQPKGAHPELRSSYRMCSYMFNLKIQLKSTQSNIAKTEKQMEEMDAELAAARKELEEQRRELAERIKAQHRDSQLALEVQKGLEEHCQQINQQLSNTKLELRTVQRERDLLAQELDRRFYEKNGNDYLPERRPSVSTSIPPPHPIVNKNLARITAPQPSEQPDSLLISPFPATSLLPMDGSAPLPELEDDEETDYDEEEVSTPSTGHGDTLVARESLRTSPGDHVQPLPPRAPELPKSLPPGSLSRSSPYRDHRRPRACSSPSQPSSRAQSPGPSSPISPPDTPLPLARDPPLRQNGMRNVHPDSLQQQLRNVLSDATISMSLPTTHSSSFHSSMAMREQDSILSRSEQLSPIPSRTPSSTTPKPHQVRAPNATDSVSQLLASHPQPLPPLRPPVSASPNSLPRVGTSSASDQAKKQEELRQARRRAEKLVTTRNQTLDAERATQAAMALAQQSQRSSPPTLSTTTSMASLSQVQPPRENMSSGVYNNPVGATLHRSGTYGRSGAPPTHAAHQQEHPSYAGMPSNGNWYPPPPSGQPAPQPPMPSSQPQSQRQPSYPPKPSGIYAS